MSDIQTVDNKRPGRLLDSGDEDIGIVTSKRVKLDVVQSAKPDSDTDTCAQQTGEKASDLKAPIVNPIANESGDAAPVTSSEAMLKSKETKDLSESDMIVIQPLMQLKEEPVILSNLSLKSDIDVIKEELPCIGDVKKESEKSLVGNPMDKVPSKMKENEKENIEMKMEKPLSPDVIMLSDEEDDLKALTHDGTPQTATIYRGRILKKIKALQNQLRNEEATLVLLKKLRQSQISQPQEPVQQTPLHRPHPSPKHVNQQTLRPHRDPPPLVKGQQPISKNLHTTMHSQQMWEQQMNNPSLRSHQGPPPLVVTPRAGNGHGTLPQQSSQMARMPQSLSKTNDASRTQPRVQQQQQQQQQQLPQPPQQQVPQKPAQVATPVAPPPPPPPQDTQTPAQRQAAAKQALRKQLEKTLLQIPPPKPPPPEMNFIPSLACPDFILLLGLEEVVNHMIDFQLIARGQKNPDERFVCTPFTCVQCGSDFTPVWKREKPGSKNVICEHCVTTNQKKALKQEHTNRLKSAFVKALQQEQEIERMQASTPTTIQPSSSGGTPQPQHPSTPMISAAGAAAAAAAANVAAAAAAAANYRPSAEQLRQHHKFYQQAQLRAGQPLGLQAFSHRSPFPYNLPFAKQQDLQRQYLLDMIPRGSMPWKQ